MSAGTRRYAIVVAGMLLALFAAPSARAGSYEVVACDRSVAGGAAPSWAPAANAGWTPVNQCPTNGLVASVPPGAVQRGWLENASWDFIAPPGTRLGTLTADISTARTGSDQWTIAVVAWDDNVLVPEWRNYGCYSQQPCTIPSGFRHVTLDFAGLLGVRVTAACWGANPCTGDAGGRIAMTNARMTVLDDSRPALSVSGPLWVDGAHLRTDEVLVDAADNAGIRSISLLVDGVQKAIAVSDCQATQRIPCPNVDDSPLSLAGTDVPDGVHTLTVRATDAAGNTTDAVRNIQIVSPPATRLTARAARRHGRAAKRPHVSVRHSLVVRGQLTFDATRAPLAGQPIQVFATQLRTAGARQPIGATQTDATGRFSFRVPPGPARLVRFSYPGDPAQAGGSAAAVSVRVPASTTIHAKPRHVRLHHSTAISGRLRLAGALNPRPGKLVIVQAFERGRWHTVATTRSRPSGTWRRKIRFDARPGSYRLRALIRRERSFPFVTGTSRSVRVTVVP